MSFDRIAGRFVLGALLAFPTLASAQAAAPIKGPVPRELPVKYTGKPTTPAISAADLMTRLYIYADDSLMGRQVGTENNIKATAYIEREVRRLGLVPAGDNGGYFQNIPLFTNYTDTAATRLKTGDQPLAYGTDYFPIPRAGRTINFDGLPVIYGGIAGDSASWPSADAVAGKVVLLTLPTSANPFRGVVYSATSRFGKAAAILVTNLDRIPAAVLPQIERSTALREEAAPTAAPTSILVTPRIATLLFGPTDTLKAGAVGKSLSGTIALKEERAPGRNVVAILPGSDPALKGQYVAIGAHNDHVGYNHHPVDHDSLRAYMSVARPRAPTARPPRASPPSRSPASVP